MSYPTAASAPGQSNRIALEGEWDLSRRDELAALLAPLVPDGPITIDMQRTTYADSTVLAALVALTTRLQAAPITLLYPQPQILRVLKIANFDKIFAIVEAGEAR